MEKVKVTQEQADWLGKYELSQEQIDHYINIQPFKKRPDSPIVDWSASKLARALYIGYEVKPVFRVRDWVVHENGVVSRIIKITESGVIFTDYPLDEDETRYINTFERYFRHATPEEIAKEKERRWWAKHGREVWELKGHDVLTHNFVNGNYIVSTIYKGLVSFYGINDNRTLEDVKENFKVKYFAEDRKDIEQS